MLGSDSGPWGGFDTILHGLGLKTWERFQPAGSCPPGTDALWGKGGTLIRCGREGALSSGV